VRHPVTIAHTLATFGQLTSGQLVLALGRGLGLPANRAEFAAVAPLLNAVEIKSAVKKRSQI
jgi:alkanesulfonate monooxygenase SsuD/methylene tetrahydromethanopterin reductase-like flavin-dependent oxidoreductase (luciferase family)